MRLCNYREGRNNAKLNYYIILLMEFENGARGCFFFSLCFLFVNYTKDLRFFCKFKTFGEIFYGEKKPKIQTHFLQFFFF
jgi:hypothetical protein